jgi:hypothetical protein
MNIKASGDIKTLVFSMLTFIVILGGFISISSNFMNSGGVISSNEYISIQSIQNDNSSAKNYIYGIDSSKRDESDSDNDNFITKGLQKIGERFEDTMLNKAFVSIKVVLNADNVVSDISNNEGINSIFEIPNWVKWVSGIFLGLLLLFASIYFFRGLS